jgi:hypothetical protein
MSAISKLAKAAKKKIGGETEIDIEALSAKTQAVIDNDQKAAREHLEKLREVTKVEFKNQNPTLFDSIYQHVVDESIEGNMYNQLRLTFNLPPENAFLESILENRLENMTMTFEYNSLSYVASFAIVVKADV